MLKGLCGHRLGAKAKEGHKAAEAPGWESGAELIRDLLLISCVASPKCLHFSWPQFLSLCIILGGLDLNISEVSLSSEILFFILFLVLWTCALSLSRPLHHWHYLQESPENSFLGFHCEGNSGSHPMDFCPQLRQALMAQFLNGHPLSLLFQIADNF